MRRLKVCIIKGKYILIFKLPRSHSRSRSGQGQDMVRSGQTLTPTPTPELGVGPELYTKIDFHPATREFLAKVIYILMMDHKMIKDDPE